MLLFVVAETMFFIGLVFAALALRRGFAVWPPPDAPTLDPALLALGTAALVLSSLTARRATRSMQSGEVRAAASRAAATAALGAAFLAGQVALFAQIGGWRPAEGMYGTLFEVLAGFHALHAVLGIGIWLVVLWRLRTPLAAAAGATTVLAAELYWHFVTLVWLGLLVVWLLP